MYLLIVFLPLISALVAGMFGRFVGREGAKYITTSAIFITFLMSCTAFYEVALLGRPAYLDLSYFCRPGIVLGLLHILTHLSILGSLTSTFFIPSITSRVCRFTRPR